MANKKLDLEEFYKKLDDLFKAKDLQATTDYMESTLAEAEASADKYGIIAASNELGSLCRATGRIERAKDLYANVLKLIEELDLKDSQQYATALINLGDVYLMTDKPEGGLDYFLKAEKLLIDCGAAESYPMAALCNNISMVYRQSGDFEKAENALNKAFSIIEKMPQCRAELATNYVNLGELQVKQGKITEAADSFKAAIDIYEKETASLDVHYSSAVSGLGEVRYLQGDMPAALTYYRKALALIERDFGKTPAYNMIKKNIERLKHEGH